MSEDLFIGVGYSRYCKMKFWSLSFKKRPLKDITIKLMCPECSDDLSTTDKNINPTPCDVLHYDCFVLWMERMHNWPECSEVMEPYLLRSLSNGEDYSALCEMYESYQREMEFNLSKLHAADEFIRTHKDLIAGLEISITKIKNKMNDTGLVLEDKQIETLNGLQTCKTELIEIQSLMEVAFKECSQEIRKLKYSIKMLKKLKMLQSILERPMTLHEQLKVELKHEPRGCSLLLTGFPNFVEFDPIQIKSSIEVLGGKVAVVAYTIDDRHAYVRLFEGDGNSAELFMKKLKSAIPFGPQPNFVCNGVLIVLRILRGRDEEKFLKLYLQERDRLRTGTTIPCDEINWRMAAKNTTRPGGFSKIGRYMRNLMPDCFLTDV